MDLSRPRPYEICDRGGGGRVIRVKHIALGSDDDNRVYNNQGQLYAIELMDQIPHLTHGKWEDFHDVPMGTVLFRCFSGWRILLNRVRKLHHPYWINRRNESMVHLSSFMLTRIPKPKAALSSFMLTRIPKPKAAKPVGEGLPPACWLHQHYSHMPCPGMFSWSLVFVAGTRH